MKIAMPPGQVILSLLHPIDLSTFTGTCDMQPGAAVVVGGKLNGLGVCRSLGRAGVRSYLLDRKRWNPGMWSRHARPIVVPALDGPSLMNALLDFQATLGEQPFLIITDEMSALTISEHRQMLDGKFRIHLPSHKTVLTLHNKALFHEYALQHGLSVPNAAIVREPSDILKLRTLRFPVVIKPADKSHFHSGAAPRLVVAETLDVGLKTCQTMLEIAGDTIVYEWIAGADDTIYFSLFYRVAGQTVSMFTGRKLASTPPGTGSTAFCTAADDARETLEPMTNAILDMMDYAGFGSIEYKWDAAARRFVIIEPTVGRTDWQEEIATLSGVNIPLDAYRHEFSLPPLPRTRENRPIVWQASCFDRLTLAAVAIPIGAAIFDGYWRIDDPLPALAHYPYDLCVAAYYRLRGKDRS